MFACLARCFAGAAITCGDRGARIVGSDIWQRPYLPEENVLCCRSDRQAESVFNTPFPDFVQPPCFALYAPIVVDALDGALVAGRGVALRSKALIPEIVVGGDSGHAGCQAIAGVAQRDCHGSLYSCGVLQRRPDGAALCSRGARPGLRRKGVRRRHGLVGTKIEHRNNTIWIDIGRPVVTAI